VSPKIPRVTKVANGSERKVPQREEKGKDLTGDRVFKNLSVGGSKPILPSPIHSFSQPMPSPIVGMRKEKANERLGERDGSSHHVFPPSLLVLTKEPEGDT